MESSFSYLAGVGTQIYLSKTQISTTVWTSITVTHCGTWLIGHTSVSSLPVLVNASLLLGKVSASSEVPALKANAHKQMETLR